MATPVLKTVRKVGETPRVLVACSNSPRERESGSFPFSAAGVVKALNGSSAIVSTESDHSYITQMSHPV